MVVDSPVGWQRGAPPGASHAQLYVQTLVALQYYPRRSLTWCRFLLAAPKALLLLFFLQVYGQGSGLDCRHHVQKLNLLQGEAEEAIDWTSR